MDLYQRISCQSCLSLNEIILKKYAQLNHDDFTKKTHLFNGRYENIYIEETKIPELNIIIRHAVEYAAEILNTTQEKLVFGFWLNVMESGDVTTAHTHDDEDELLSCVYYVEVPNKSGDLIIIKNNDKTIIKPTAGDFIFFAADTLHEVSKNESGQSRLSIAFNFGLK